MYNRYIAGLEQEEEVKRMVEQARAQDPEGQESDESLEMQVRALRRMAGMGRGWRGVRGLSRFSPL